MFSSHQDSESDGGVAVSTYLIGLAGWGHRKLARCRRNCFSGCLQGHWIHERGDSWLLRVRDKSLARLAFGLPIFHSLLSHAHHLARLRQVWDPSCALGWRLILLGPIKSIRLGLQGLRCHKEVWLGQYGVMLG